MPLELKDIAIPLVSAAVASGLTHLLTFRRTKSELLLKDRVQAFSDLHRKLVELMRYCQARAAEEDGSDFSEKMETLSHAENKSVLEHLHELRAIQDKSFIFLPKSLNPVFKELEKRLMVMCGHELRIALDELGQMKDPDAPTQMTAGYYVSLAALVRTTIERVYRNNPLR